LVDARGPVVASPDIWARIVAKRHLGAELTQFCDGFAPRSPFATNRAQMVNAATA
jgi:hypothetical protein